MLLHFKKSNELLETWSPHCKNLAFKDPPSLNFHNRTDASVGAIKIIVDIIEIPISNPTLIAALLVVVPIGVVVTR